MTTTAITEALAQFSRTDLTAYETEQLQAARVAVKAQSLAVGSFVFGSGNPDYLQAAADLYLDLLAKLTADADIRTGALGYGLFLAMGRANDRHASQASVLQGKFLIMLFENAIADRASAKVGA